MCVLQEVTLENFLHLTDSHKWNDIEQLRVEKVQFFKNQKLVANTDVSDIICLSFLKMSLKGKWIETDIRIKLCQQHDLEPSQSRACNYALDFVVLPQGQLMHFRSNGTFKKYQKFWAVSSLATTSELEKKSIWTTFQKATTAGGRVGLATNFLI